jgi:hypothetical protein
MPPLYVPLPTPNVVAATSIILSGLAEAGLYEGAIAYVQTYGDFFSWHPGLTLTASSGVVINGTSGQWTRMYIPNPKWQAQTTWSIDESNVSGLASDENSGIDDTHPLLTIAEFTRRMQRLPVTGTIVVRWMSDTTSIQVNLAAMGPGNTPLPTPENFPVIVFVGVPTVLRSGTLDGATDAPWTVSDSTLPTSWAASGLVSTSTGTRLIRKTDKTKHAFIGYENVAKTAQTSPTNGYNENLVWTPFGVQAASFANGDAYEVLSLPKFPRVTPPDYSAGFGAAVFMLLDMDGILGGQAHVRHCGFRQNSVSLNSIIRSGVHQLYGTIFVGTVTIAGLYGSNALSRSMFLGTVNLLTYNGDMNTLINVIAKAGNWRINHTSVPRIGTVYMYDTTITPVIQINNNSVVTLDALHGSNNTGVLVDIRDSGCSVNSTTTTPLTAFDATTTAPNPISVVGTTYAYAAIPIDVPTHNASFTTN